MKKNRELGSVSMSNCFVRIFPSLAMESLELMFILLSRQLYVHTKDTICRDHEVGGSIFMRLILDTLQRRADHPGFDFGI